MTSSVNTPITLYTSSFCSHSWAVERFIEQNEVPVTIMCIDQDVEAREQLIEINNGYASVPTIIFPDGTHLTEPSFGQLRAKLGIENPGLVARIKKILDR